MRVRHVADCGYPSGMQSLRDHYLAQAEEAEKQAELATYQTTKNVWLKRAAYYRELARQQERQ